MVVQSIDWLGRNCTEILEQWSVTAKRQNAAIVVLDISDMVLQLLSYVAQKERESIQQRQAEGIAAAKARGVHLGPMAQPLPDMFAELHKAWRSRKNVIKGSGRRLRDAKIYLL